VADHKKGTAFAKCFSKILHLTLSTVLKKVEHSSKKTTSLTWLSPRKIASKESAHTNLFLAIKSLKLKPNLVTCATLVRHPSYLLLLISVGNLS
jgi:hypothetical protein